MSNKLNQYLALLRGINVGGNNIIKMVDLKACFEEIGFTNVVTYIQSGNVIFKDTDLDEDNLAKKIETRLLKVFTTPVKVVVISYQHLKEVFEDAPNEFGTKLTTYRYDVIFLKKPLTPNDAIKNVLLEEGVDQVGIGKKVLYFARLIEKATQSKLSRIVAMPMYKNMTIRNWKTTTKLLALMEK